MNPLDRVLGGILDGSHAMVWIVFSMCCGLLIASTLIPPWQRWIVDTYHRVLRRKAKVHVPPAEYLLQILHSNPNAAVDIVAVHGLGANPAYAWVPLNSPDGQRHAEVPFNWLKELLPAELSCRVMAFNYDSKWFWNAPQQRPSNISDDLLRSLRDNRKNERAIGRPLIFIGHSFGGIVIEQAVVSSLSRSAYKDIGDSTVGFVFFGTPHRGSLAATLGSLIASLPFPGSINERRILRVLEEQSDTLADLLGQFSDWLFENSVPAVCCFEKRMTAVPIVGKYMRSIKQLVVSQDSACIDGHPRIGLDADHSKMNKFYGRNDPSFQLVYPEIVRMSTSAQEMLTRRRNPKTIPIDQSATSGELRKCLQEMGVRNPRDVLSDIQTQKEKRVPHTCEWILKRKEFSAWGADDSPRLLRLIGSPGIGKTIMSTFLIEVLKKKVEKSHDKLFAFFFCDDKIHDRRTPEVILKSLIWQLLLQRNDLFKHVQSDFEAQGSTLFKDFSALWRIFQNMLRDEHVGEVFILVDALDECDSSTRKGLVYGIRELFQSPPISGVGRFKFLITCRPEIRDIESALKDVGICLRMDTGEVNQDLSEYIDFKVDLLEYPLDVKENVRNTLKSKSGGTFLWVSIMLADLEGALIHQVEEKLKTLPVGLDNTYDKILDRIPVDKREVSLFVLCCMVAARRPLRKEEIEAAYATWHTRSVLPRQRTEVYADIYSACSSIIYIGNTSKDSEANMNTRRAKYFKYKLNKDSEEDTATLNFCHQSVKDFLLNDHGGTKREWYHASKDNANLLIFQACWRYLSSEAFDHSNLFIDYESRLLPQAAIRIREWNSPPQSHFTEYPLLLYAYEEWLNHAISSNPAALDMLRINSTKESELTASCPALFRRLQIDFANAPILCDAWLFCAAEEGQEETIAALCKKRANVNIKNGYGRTPLLYAAGLGHEGIVKLLLATKEIDSDLRDDDGRTALSYAAERGHEGIVTLLLETKQVDADSRSNYRRSRSFVAKGGHRTPLSYAAERGHKGIVKLLLEIEKVDANSRDNNGRTPLSYAAEGRHDGIVKLLLEIEKVDADSRDDNGRTPLSYAAEGMHEGIVKLLLEIEKVDADSRDDDGRTPLSYAAKSRHEGIVKLLLATKKVNVNSKDTDDQTPLSQASEYGHEGIVKLLLATKEIDADSKDRYGQTPLSWAAKNGHEASVKLLLQTKKLDVNSKNTNNRTPLSQASKNGHEGIVKLLLATKEIDADSKDRYGQTPLSWAAKNGHVGIVKLLLATKKVDVNWKDKWGRRLLSRVASKAIKELLLEAGAKTCVQKTNSVRYNCK